jgi:hypothetical protein
MRETVSANPPSDFQVTDRLPGQPIIPVDLLPRAAEAWERIQVAMAEYRRAQQDFRHRQRAEDWFLIAQAIAFGRAKVMKDTGAEKPAGRRYNKAMSEWLRAKHLNGIGKSTRSRLAEIAAHLEEISAWHARVDANDRIRVNHPRTILERWRKDTGQADPKGASSSLLEQVAAAGPELILPLLEQPEWREFFTRRADQHRGSVRGVPEQGLTEVFIKLLRLGLDDTATNRELATLVRAAAKAAGDSDDLEIIHRAQRGNVIQLRRAG